MARLGWRLALAWLLARAVERGVTAAVLAATRTDR